MSETSPELNAALLLHTRQPYPLGPALHAARLLLANGERDQALYLLTAYARRYGDTGRGGEALLAVVEHAPVKRFPAGAIIVSEGDRSDSLYVVVRGQVEVDRAGAGRLALLGPGQSFGEIAALARTPRTATVLASTDVDTLRVSRKILSQLSSYFAPLEPILRAVYRDRLLAQLIPPGSVFSTLDPARRHELFAKFVPCATARGEFVMHESQEGFGFCVIVSGRARVWRWDLSRRAEEIATLGPGDFFGEISLLYEIPVTATVQARDDLVYYLLERDHFLAFMKAWPDETQRLMDIARRRMGILTVRRGLDVSDTFFGRPPGANAAAADLRFSEDSGISEHMTCPRCGFDQDASPLCAACGSNVAHAMATGRVGRMSAEMPALAKVNTKSPRVATPIE